MSQIDKEVVTLVIAEVHDCTILDVDDNTKLKHLDQILNDLANEGYYLKPNVHVENILSFQNLCDSLTGETH